ncbi:type II toxin-antitoxin system ParD family antitoxin [Halomicronema sp. CCY15110]|uniref:ribbon-helix-helix domain-containing protein n=1 Tax=Halomicronema sp. CCY15110 TaxID=2767773 RepID=UPI00194F30B2|nr:type II toxin-antitoxin system ParD family antitoxin [Halomicronema sp. CCY15110]
MEISLPPKLVEFVDQQVNSGKYDSVDAVILAGVELLAQRETAASGAKFADLLEDPVVGMWQDREDMPDSTAWVRQVRQQEWERVGGTDAG